MATAQCLHIHTLVLTTKQALNTNMVTFDSPEFEKMLEQDNQFLSKGKIDWEAKILSIANRIAECEKQLAIPDVALKLYSEEHPEFSIEQHKADFGERLIRARAELANLIASISDKEANDRIEALANEIKNWDKQEGQFSWKDVALSILELPERITFDYDRCPDCGYSRIRIYFHSPKWTWAMMCGKAGEMAICPSCKTQSALFGMITSN